MFTTSSMDMVDDSFLPSLTDNDWFMNSIFGDQDLVYNDKNLGETAPQPCIKSEHSYSSNNLSPTSPFTLAKGEEPDIAVFHSQNASTDLNQSGQLVQHTTPGPHPQHIKCESPSSDPLLSAMVTSDSTPTFTHAPTIILATTTTSSAVPAYGSQSVFPTATVHIKTDPADTIECLQEQTVNMDTVVLPPTPPSSNGSDSDGSQSPQRSAPNSPQRQSPVRLYHYQTFHRHHHHHASSSDIDSCLAGHTFSQPLFLSPMPQSGVLILSEEEKRTLISEGYPIPSKLPLTKQEEKNLKKVRRKIKNKISAQESRRKKKEYLEQLEKRVEAFNHENCDLKKKVETLESNNRSLLGQLQKLQAMLSKVPKTAAASATQTGTVLMVLVLCFAVFLGGSGTAPSSPLNVGYSTVAKPPLVFQQQPGPLRVQPSMGPGAPRAPAHTADDYTTPNLKSRVLMAFSKEDPDDLCDEYPPLMPWKREESCPTDKADEDFLAEENRGPTDPGVEDVMPTVTQTTVVDDGRQQSSAVVTIAVGADNTTAQESEDEYQAMMHPDIAVAPTLGHGNFTADLETA